MESALRSKLIIKSQNPIKGGGKYFEAGATQEKYCRLCNKNNHPRLQI